MMFNKNQKPLYIHELFSSLVSNFVYFITGLDMIMQRDIQKEYLRQKKGYFEIEIIKVKYPEQPLKFCFKDVFHEFSKENKIQKINPNIYIRGNFRKFLKSMEFKWQYVYLIFYKRPLMKIV